MGMDRYSGSRRHRVNNHRYYKHLLLALLRKVDGLIVETYLRCTLRIIIVNLSSLRSRRMILQLRSHLESSDYYGNQPLRQLMRELVQLKCDQDISNVIGRARFSQFLSKRELRSLGLDYAGTLQQRLQQLSNHEQSEEELQTPFLEPIEPQEEQPAYPQIVSDTEVIELDEDEISLTPYIPIAEVEIADQILYGSVETPEHRSFQQVVEHTSPFIQFQPVEPISPYIPFQPVVQTDQISIASPREGFEEGLTDRWMNLTLP